MSIRNLLLLLISSLWLSGCSIVYSDVKQAYVTAKVIYQDAKYGDYRCQLEALSRD